MIRPGAEAALRRWAETLIGAAVVLVGLLWVPRGGGALGWVVAAGGLALAVAGAQRARFGAGGGGPGIVSVTEGRIAYFGPRDGGIADLDAITALTYEPQARPAAWRLDRAADAPLVIPANAEGAERLFDAFAALPGLDTEAVLRARRSAADGPVVIWRRGSVHPAVTGPH
ncbi:hypothetical protein ROJ8625_02982 [Roseivivax jejudonensis]|uniref:Uncharacterized protein n=1 Tax=Roseivivax jejudonensis TaxID=1529041 RepID=A0A1X6ZRG0_9RHOB|nr:hypothetical protein [Roseivivax jejudonensis]SLN59121.1 hypothetical protein ROJ8625_02982 [Roseivivax jejudonensis]